MKPLPDKIHGHVGGNHKVAVDRTRDILDYVKKAISYLEAAAGEGDPALMRGAYLRTGDEYLDTIIRFANCAKRQLRLAHCPDYPDEADTAHATVGEE